MKSQTAFINKSSGFTLIEMLIVIGIILIVGGVSLFFGFDTLRGYSFHTDRDTLVSVLQHARAEAMANICRGNATACLSGGQPQGVYIDTVAHKFVIFQGSTYSAADTNNVGIDFNKSTAFPSGLTQVVFDQLSGNVDTAGSIIVGDQTNVHMSQIDINSAGQILWSN